VTAAPAPPSDGQRVRRRRGTPWPEARLVAGRAQPLPPVRLPLADALGRVLAADLVAVNDLPAADNSAMDGWAVAGAPPWRIVADPSGGRVPTRRLRSGECARIATGATVPVGTDAVLPVEDSFRDGIGVRPAAPWTPEAFARSHIRARGEEARTGDVLLAAGTLITPPIVGLAAAVGNDDLLVVRSATVDVLVLGDELVDAGRAGPGRTRDALGPQLPGWLAGLGAPVRSVRRLPDDLDDLTATITASDADVLLTTGSTSVGACDHLHRAIARTRGRVVVDGVDVKPGHPMVLAALPKDRWLVGLPGNPLAACVALVTLVEPLTAALRGLQPQQPSTVRLGCATPARPGDGHRLLPVRGWPGGVAELQPSCGSAMLRGLARATGLAVVGPHGAAEDDEVDYLQLPWPAPARRVTSSET
jgi:molybdopterin molybdotransferase